MSENATHSQTEEIELLPAGRINAPRRVAKPPTGKRGPAAINRDIRATIQAAFYAAGGRRYLEKVALKRPDVFLALVGKVVPTETKVSVLASYQGIPVQVEDRDGLLPIAPPSASQAVLDAVSRAAVEAATDHGLAPIDDWLALEAP